MSRNGKQFARSSAAPRKLDLRNRVVAITGGASGIGLQTAKAVAARGGYPSIVDIDGDRARSAASEIGGNALGLAADVCDFDSLKAALEETVRHFGGIDVIVANAGIEHSGLAVGTGSRLGHQLVLDVNLKEFGTLRGLAYRT